MQNSPLHDNQKQQERMKLNLHLAKPQGMLLPVQLEAATDKNDDATRQGRWLGIDGADYMVALIKRQLGELSQYVISPLDLVSLKREHRRRLIQSDERAPVVIKQVVVMLHKRSCHHFDLFFHISAFASYRIAELGGFYS